MHFARDPRCEANTQHAVEVLPLEAPDLRSVFQCFPRHFLVVGLLSRLPSVSILLLVLRGGVSSLRAGIEVPVVGLKGRKQKQTKRFKTRTKNAARLGQIIQIVIYLSIYLSTVDDLAPHLPLREVVQNLHGTDPTQETCAIADHADYTGPTRQHELDHTRSGIDLSALKDLDHKAEIDDKPEV